MVRHFSPKAGPSQSDYIHASQKANAISSDEIPGLNSPNLLLKGPSDRGSDMARNFGRVRNHKTQRIVLPNTFKQLRTMTKGLPGPPPVPLSYVDTGPTQQPVSQPNSLPASPVSPISAADGGPPLPYGWVMVFDQVSEKWWAHWWPETEKQNIPLNLNHGIIEIRARTV
jgi:hypothetical protein